MVGCLDTAGRALREVGGCGARQARAVTGRAVIRAVVVMSEPAGQLPLALQAHHACNRSLLVRILYSDLFGQEEY